MLQQSMQGDLMVFGDVQQQPDQTFRPKNHKERQRVALTEGVRRPVELAKTADV